MVVLGVDPGLSGAIAAYDGARLLHVCDLPTYKTLVGKREKTKLDISELLHLAGEMRARWGAELACIEGVSASPQQGVTSAFTFGFGTGALYTAFSGFRYRIEIVTPQAWKKAMRAPKLKEASCHRADELFPEHKHEWRSKRGGLIDGRAEAAMIARYGFETFCKGS